MTHPMTLGEKMVWATIFAMELQARLGEATVEIMTHPNGAVWHDFKFHAVMAAAEKAYFYLTCVDDQAVAVLDVCRGAGDMMAEALGGAVS